MKKLTTLAAAAAALALAGGAHATTFLGDYTVTAINSSDPGLKVYATDLPGAITLNLTTLGQTQTVDLFTLWTDENNVKWGEDTVPKPISVLFNFTTPGAASGAITGDTFGVWGILEKGRVTWDSPITLSFSDGAKLRVSLNDADFNKDCAFCELNPGVGGGATISAKFKLTAAAVPEPATWAMMITGFGLVGATVRRRRAAGLAV